MGMFDIFKHKYTVNEAVNLASEDPGSFMVDIRPKDRYKKGHVRGAINIPEEQMSIIKTRIRDKNAKIYIIGHDVAAAHQYAKKLRKMEYVNVFETQGMEEHHGVLQVGK